ncbi:MAG TPA: zf-HC2 domain-containing protein [Anaerolineae bacterium]|nr:zf-HC2 domain-containing protein [Anaerolineae bacterium]HOQ97192.1 zf-HC2 domain-containing protein [Anaerolineae bacterium]HPL26418.1 zf-HC2 domain-containing protein [Anaerolineae bacterium]
MNCSWKDAEAQRFAEGSLDPERQAAFDAHLEGCAVCRARVAEAQRVEGLLRAGITPVAAPVTLASRVASATAAEREGRRARRGLLVFGRRFSPALVGVAAALVLAVAAYTVAPGAVLALAQRVLFFVPGLGIKPAGDSTLVATAPVSVPSGALTFTVEALLSDGTKTTVKFRLAGLPGGKQGWSSQPPKDRVPVLRDAAGREYGMTGGFQGVGGSMAENVVEGEFGFAPLPGDLRSIDVIMPLDYLVPAAVVPGADQQSLVAQVRLAPPAESGLPAATPQGAQATANGVTLRVAASSLEAGRTVVLVEGETEGMARVTMLGRPGDDSAAAAALRDDRGRTYPLAPEGDGTTVVGNPFHKDLYFAPVAPGAGRFTLNVAAVQVMESAATSVTIPLEGHKAGETFALDRAIDLGGHQVVLTSARLGSDQLPGQEPQTWLYVSVDLGLTADGRTLWSFSARRASGDGSSMWSYGTGEGDRFFGVPVGPGDKSVTIDLHSPIVVVEGPWEVSFPAGQ